MQGKLSSIVRWSLLALFIFALMIIPSARSFAGPTHSTGSNIDIAYPAMTHLCVDGCREHQNWIEFYLVSNSYIDSSLRLKTSLFLAQILTYGISSTLCAQQDKPGYTCVEMEVSYRLLSGLIDLNLSPLGQLRDNRNWWLEYQSTN